MRWASVLVMAVLTAACHDGGEVGPCVFVACSGHGACVAVDGDITCECHDGYVAEGHRCEPVEADGDADADMDEDSGSDGGADGAVDGRAGGAVDGG